MRWSRSAKGPTILLLEEDTVARSTVSWGHCVCSASPLPSTGVHYVELVFTRGADGYALGGSYMAGVLSAEQASGELIHGGNGLARMDKGFWGVDDSGGTAPFENSGIRDGTGLKAGAPAEAKTDRPGKGGRVFRDGTRVGLFVDMADRTLTIYRDGTPIPGLTFKGLPAEVYVGATLDDREASVRIIKQKAPPVPKCSPASPDMAEVIAVASASTADAPVEHGEFAPACVAQAENRYVVVDAIAGTSAGNSEVPIVLAEVVTPPPRIDVDQLVTSGDAAPAKAAILPPTAPSRRRRTWSSWWCCYTPTSVAKQPLVNKHVAPASDPGVQREFSDIRIVGSVRRASSGLGEASELGTPISPAL